MTAGKKTGPLRFPEGFLWGAATSHFQVEGHPHETESRFSDWSAWTCEDGKIFDQTTADTACEFHTRYESDIKLCKELHLNAFRLSLNWPALMPDADGGLRPDVVAYYRELLTELRRQGLKTFVTLFHFTLPLRLAKIGGWTNEETVKEFVRFTELAAQELGDLVDYWITINEPLAYVYQGYVAGSWPPGVRDNYLEGFKCLRRMIEGHAGAYQALKQYSKDAQVSFTIHWRPFLPKRKWHPLDYLIRYYRDYIFNHLFPNAVQTGHVKFPWPLNRYEEIKKLGGEVPGCKGSMDYLAINYYTRELSMFKPGWPLDLFGSASMDFELETNEMGWEIYPEGLYHALTKDLAPYHRNSDGTVRPIVITENGYASTYSAELIDGDWSLNDDRRVKYLKNHLMAVHRAIDEGAHVVGYLYWSLLDNFEWAEGLRARFGLVRVAFPTQERTLRRSARVYAEIASENALDVKVP